MTIEITQDDIESGKPTADSCPIALASTRALKLSCQVYYSFIMDRKKAWLMVNLGNKKYAIYNLETEIAKWAYFWDQAKGGKPFSFIINTKGLIK